MNDSYRITIRAATNGFIVTYADPATVEQNRKPDTSYKDPDVSVLFKDADAMAEGVAKLAPLLGAALEKDMDFDRGLVDALADTSTTNEET